MPDLKPTMKRCLWPTLLASLGLGVGTLAAAEQPLRVTLLGQSLIKVDLRTAAPLAVEQARAYLPADSVVLSNLEVAIAAPDVRVEKRNAAVARVGPEVLDALGEMGVDMLALSNNHALDLGVSGLMATLDELTARGIAHAGAGRDLESALKPGLIERPEGRYALIGIASGGVQLSPETWASPQRAGVNFLELRADGSLNPSQARQILETIRAAAQNADLVLVYHHNHYWGAPSAARGVPLREPRSRRYETPDWMRQFAREVIDAGASVYWAHGNPALHGIEIYRGKPVFYGLGNYIFHAVSHPDRFGPLAFQSAAIDVEFAATGRLSSIRIAPLALTLDASDHGPRGTPYLADSEDAQTILLRLAHLSRRYGTEIVVEGNEGFIKPSTLQSDP
jgi:poly-gamma-glutamate synthesis protein (capsule biosynthesis protein)